MNNMPLKLGLIVSMQKNLKKEITKVRKLGFPTCQVACWDVSLYNKDVSQKLKKAAEDNDVEITSEIRSFL